MYQVLLQKKLFLEKEDKQYVETGYALHKKNEVMETDKICKKQQRIL